MARVSDEKRRDSGQTEQPFEGSALMARVSERMGIDESFAPMIDS